MEFTIYNEFQFLRHFKTIKKIEIIYFMQNPLIFDNIIIDKIRQSK
jgi:hypothetical protein